MPLPSVVLLFPAELSRLSCVAQGLKSKCVVSGNMAKIGSVGRIFVSLTMVLNYPN